jgi:hypothetical protein
LGKVVKGIDPEGCNVITDRQDGKEVGFLVISGIVEPTASIQEATLS